MDVWELEGINPEPSRPVVLRSDDGAARVIALAIPEGQVLGEHQVHEHTWLTVLEGTLAVDSGGATQNVASGMLLHFDPAERRTVRATTDAKVLYVLAPWPGPGHPSLAGVAGAADAQPD